MNKSCSQSLDLTTQTLTIAQATHRPNDWELVPYVAPGGMHIGSSVYTPYGAQKISELAPGDVVMTLEYGFQEVSAIGRKVLPEAEINPSIRLNPLPGDRVEPAYLCPAQRVLVRDRSVLMRVLGKKQAVFEARFLGEQLGASSHAAPFSEYFNLVLPSPATLWTPVGLIACPGADGSFSHSQESLLLTPSELTRWINALRKVQPSVNSCGMLT